MDTHSTQDDIEKEKRAIEKEQTAHAEEIVESDEAAQSAEGMDNASDDFHQDVPEDRDATPPAAIDLPDGDSI